MQASKDLLDLDRFDTYLEPEVLVNNAKELADYLSQPNVKVPIESMQPTMSYLIGTNEIMNTDNVELQLHISRCFVHAFKITVPQPAIEQRSIRFLGKLFHLVLNALTSEEVDNEMKENLMYVANDIGFFVLSDEPATINEIFERLIDTKIKGSVEAISSMLNAQTRFPPTIIEKMATTLLKNKNVGQVLAKLEKIKQTEFIQGIHNYISDAKVFDCYRKISKILKLSPEVLFPYFEVDIINDDNELRTGAIELAIRILTDNDYITDLYPKYVDIINRHIDRLPKIRSSVCTFMFEVLKKLDSDTVDISKSARKSIVNTIWENLKIRMVETSNEVRVTVMTNLLKMDIEDIKIDFKYIAERLRDKSAEVRIPCMKLLLSCYEAKPKKFLWLFDSLISLYPTVKDISLFGFSTIMYKHTLLEVMDNLTDRKPLIKMLNDTKEFRELLPNYKDKSTQSRLSSYMDVNQLKVMMKSLPKNFIQTAINPSKRKAAYKSAKKALKNDDDVRLLFGYYQPSPIDTSAVLECDDLTVVKELATIYADDFDVEMKKMSKRLNSTDLTVLARMRKADIDTGDRQAALKAISKIVTGKNRKLALKAFAAIYREEDKKLLSSITFKKNDIMTKIEFYARLGNPEIIPEDLFDYVSNKINTFDEDGVKWGLRLVSYEKSQRTIQIHQDILETYPIQALTSYLNCVVDCYEYNTPEVYRKFSEVIQNPEADVRLKAVRVLNTALSQPKTPINYLAYFVLSATDPEEENRTEAKKYLDAQISFRRNVLKKHKQGKYPHLEPESSLPYMINILSHHPDYEQDGNDYPTFASYLRFYMTAICKDTSDFSTILNMFVQLRFMDDIEEEYTDAMINLCDMASIIVKELGGKRNWDTTLDRNFEFSTRYFKPSSDRHRAKDMLKTMNELTKSPKIKTSVLRAGMSPSRTPKLKRNALETIENTNILKGKSAPVTPKRKAKTQSPKKKLTKLT